MRHAKPTIDERVARRLRAKLQRQALTASVTRDPRTGLVRRGAVRLDTAAGTLELMLPKRLESPNRWLWTDWRTKARAKNAWATLLRRTVCDALERPTIAAFETPAQALGWTAPPRARLEVRRFVKGGAARFITDRDNLHFAGKGLTDCLVKAGFLIDDRMDVLEVHVEQLVSHDGLDWTGLVIAPHPPALGGSHGTP